MTFSLLSSIIGFLWYSENLCWCIRMHILPQEALRRKPQLFFSFFFSVVNLLSAPTRACIEGYVTFTQPEGNESSSDKRDLINNPSVSVLLCIHCHISSFYTLIPPWDVKNFLKAEMNSGILQALRSDIISKLAKRQNINHRAHPRARAGNESSSFPQLQLAACAVITCLTRCPSAEANHHLQSPPEEHCEMRRVNDDEPAVQAGRALDWQYNWRCSTWTVWKKGAFLIPVKLVHSESRDVCLLNTAWSTINRLLNEVSVLGLFGLLFCFYIMGFRLIVCVTQNKVLNLPGCYFW